MSRKILVFLLFLMCLFTIGSVSAEDVDNEVIGEVSSTQNVVTVTNETYSQYFDSDGRIISGINSGDVVDLSGNFDLVKFNISQPITITSSNHDAVLTNSTVCLEYGADGSTISNLNIININNNSDAASYSVGINVFNVSNVNIINNYLDCENPAAIPLRLDCADYAFIENNTVRNGINESWGKNAAIVLFTSDDVVINNNTIEDGYCNGIYFSWWGGALGGGFSYRATITNNKIISYYKSVTSQNPDSYNYAIQYMGCDGYIANNYVEGTWRGISGVGFWQQYDPYNNTMTGNTIVGICGDYAIWGNLNSTVSYNNIVNCTSNGIWMENGNMKVHHNNISVTGNGVTISSFNATGQAPNSDYRVYSNKINAGKTGVLINCNGVFTYYIRIYNNDINSTKETVKDVYQNTPLSINVRRISVNSNTLYSQAVYAVKLMYKVYDVSVFSNTIYSNNYTGDAAVYIESDIQSIRDNVPVMQTSNVTSENYLFSNKKVKSSIFKANENVIEITNENFADYFPTPADTITPTNEIPEGSTIKFVGTIEDKVGAFVNKNYKFIAEDGAVLKNCLLVVCEDSTKEYSSVVFDGITFEGANKHTSSVSVETENTLSLTDYFTYLEGRQSSLNNDKEDADMDRDGWDEEEEGMPWEEMYFNYPQLEAGVYSGETTWAEYLSNLQSGKYDYEYVNTWGNTVSFKAKGKTETEILKMLIYQVRTININGFSSFDSENNNLIYTKKQTTTVTKSGAIYFDGDFSNSVVKDCTISFDSSSKASNFIGGTLGEFTGNTVTLSGGSLNVGSATLVKDNTVSVTGGTFSGLTGETVTGNTFTSEGDIGFNGISGNVINNNEFTLSSTKSSTLVKAIASGVNVQNNNITVLATGSGESTIGWGVEAKGNAIVKNNFISVSAPVSRGLVLRYASDYEVSNNNIVSTPGIAMLKLPASGFDGEDEVYESSSTILVAVSSSNGNIHDNNVTAYPNDKLTNSPSLNTVVLLDSSSVNFYNNNIVTDASNVAGGSMYDASYIYSMTVNSCDGLKIYNNVFNNTGAPYYACGVQLLNFGSGSGSEFYNNIIYNSLKPGSEDYYPVSYPIYIEVCNAKIYNNNITSLADLNYGVEVTDGIKKLELTGNNFDLDGKYSLGYSSYANSVKSEIIITDNTFNCNGIEFYKSMGYDTVKPGTAGIRLQDSSNGHIVENNTIVSNQDYAVDLRNSPSDNVVRYNHLISSDKEGDEAVLVSGSNTVEDNYGKISPVLSLKDLSAEAGSKVTVTVNVVDDNGKAIGEGSVSVSVGVNDYSADVVNGVAKVSIRAPSSSGRYVLTAVYVPENTVLYNSGESTANLRVTAPVVLVSTVTSIGDVSGEVGSSVDVSISVVDGEGVNVAGGDVVVSFNGVSETVSLIDGVAVYSFVLPDVSGEYSISASFVASGDYESSSASGLVTVFETNNTEENTTIDNGTEDVTFDTALSLIFDELSDGQVLSGVLVDSEGNGVIGDVVISLTSLGSGDVETYTVLCSDDGFSLNLDLDAGEYSARAVYSGSDKYLSSSSSKVLFVVSDVPSNVILDDSDEVTGVYGEENKFDGVLTDKEGNALAGYHIALNLTRLSSGASKVYWVTTDSEGNYILPINLAPGVYTVRTSIDDNNFTGSSLSSLIIADPNADSSDDRGVCVFNAPDLNLVNGVGGVFEGRLLDSLGYGIAGQHVDLKLSNVHGQSKVYSVTTDFEGKFFLPINLGLGTYTAESIFDGTSVYQGTSLIRNIKVE